MLLSEILNLKKNNYTQNVRERIIATNDTLRNIILQEIKKYGTNADLNHIDVSNVTDMSSIFSASKFNGDISKWDVSNVTNMSLMFSDSKFNGDISKWDVSNVTNMRFMFSKSKFNGDISNWNISNVTDIESIFDNSKFSADISKWIPMLQKNCINLTDLRYNFTNDELSDIEI